MLIAEFLYFSHSDGFPKHLFKKEHIMIRYKFFAVAFFVVGLMLITGCSNRNEIAGPQFNQPNEQDLTSAMTESELSVIEISGFHPDSSKGIFTIGWKDLFKPKEQTSLLVGNSMAVGFTRNISQYRGMRGGVDMGLVYLNYGSNHNELKKIIHPRGGVIYTSSARPRMGGPNTNIEFIANSAYEFEVTGSDKFSALRTSITAPAALINISSQTEGQSINTANDLVLTWQGGNTSGRLVIVVAVPPPRPMNGPQGGMGQMGPGGMRGPGGPGGPHGGGMMDPRQGGFPPPPMDSTRAIVIRLDSNPGSYTIGTANLQALVQRTNATRLEVMISQVTVQEVDHDGGRVHVVLRNSDRIGIIP